MRLHEIFKMRSDYPDAGSDHESESLNGYLTGAKPLSEIKPGVFLYKNGDMYILTKDDTAVGIIDTRPVSYHGKTYLEIKLVYISKNYRNSSAIKWLIYGLSELSSRHIVLADGAIFSGGERLIQYFSNSKLFRLDILNKDTGEILEFSDDYDRLEYAIRIRTHGIGFGQNHIVESVWFWYDLTDHLEDF